MTSNFIVNGKPYAVNLAQLPADITLNTFIREHAGLPATKFMCQEGGCGVCVCVVTGKHPVTGKVKTWAVNSCLTLLATCTDCVITTSEGIGNKRIGYHAIQERLAKMNGTQCGFCSPGFVMNMYGLLAANDGKVTMEEVENSFGGNICRCTGYRPILDAMKSFAVDSNIAVPAECSDIEDLAKKTCPKTGDLCKGSCKTAAKPLQLTFSDGNQWFWPKTLIEVFKAFESVKQENYMLVAGNTAHGVYRRPRDIKYFIDLHAVSSLKEHTLNSKELVLGGGLTLTEAMQVFKEAAKKPGFEYCQQLWNHFDLIANVPVRNTGTLAGNLAVKHAYKEFPSDIYIVFEALAAQVVVNESAAKEVKLTLNDYLKKPIKKCVLGKVILKPYPKEKYIFDSYKIMPRAQNAHAYVNAAFLIEIQRPANAVKSARLCFGGINPDFVHATAIEKLLIGKNLFDNEIITQALTSMHQLLKADNVLPDPSPAYRQKLACGLFYKFLLAHAPTTKLSAKLASGGQLLKRPISSGKQNFENFTENHPIGKATEKLEGLLQTSGEATYANDLPVQHNQLWGAFVTAKKIGATVTNIDTKDAMKIPGVVAFFSAKDIPGENNVTGNEAFFFPESEELFLTGTVRYHNQAIGVIVAETNALAHHAADLVKLTYSGGSAEILPTIDTVLNSASAHRVIHNKPSIIKELQVTEKFDLKASGKLDMGLQYHFFMEPHSTVVVPFEAGLQVYTSTQWMDLVQRVIVNMLKLKMNEVHIKTRRVGGGYGGKATRSNPAACAAALAAVKLNRPVRFVQSLESMMNVLGKRWAMHVDYDFYTQNTGKIIALRGSFYEDAGYSTNESPMDHTLLLSRNCYEFSDNFKLDGYMVLSDSPSNCPCRAPGSVEGIAIIENIMEHIAFEIGLDPVDVRLANLLPGHKMGQMLPHFLETTAYRARKQACADFNKEHRWRKRGLGIAVMEYHMGYFGEYPATVAIYHNDGTIAISHGGIEMGQGMNTKIAQTAAHILGVPMEIIRFEGSDSFNGANSMVTGGSIGSETVCFAVRKCCNTLNERLKPVKEALKDANWNQIIEEAYNRNILLIATDNCKQGDMEPYTVCGLSLTEVEVDILTGNYLINRVDILEDTGESLNPNVDIGQIEGAFTMGLGYWTSEQIVVDKETGEMKTNRSWNYKPPGPKDIPIDFRIELLPKSVNAGGFMRSKATGEPAICVAISVVFAMQEAIQSARDDAGLKKSWVTLTAPMTPEHIVLNSGTDISALKL